VVRATSLALDFKQPMHCRAPCCQTPTQYTSSTTGLGACAGQPEYPVACSTHFVTCNSVVLGVFEW
jgi:hypothetical protein